MKAMVLAAGLGTRLRPITDSRPKALVELNGRTLLEITLARLRRFGIRDAIVNVHHFAAQVIEYLHAHDDFGMRIAISREDELLLDTGGGLLKAADFFLRDAERASASGSSVADCPANEPFLLHNVDVLSSIELGELMQFHRRHDALVTLAVQRRKSSRVLLFDGLGQLCGRRTVGQPDEIVRTAPQVEPWAFTGIHVLSPRIFELLGQGLLGQELLGQELLGQELIGREFMGGETIEGRMGERRQECVTWQHAFPIIPEYLRLASTGEKIVAFPADGYYWRDLGTLASLQQAAEDMQRGLIEA